ncbi:hypothetical protein CDL12_00648 [Handroanthus impetiginosus]|uniref:Mediator complex subunit 15 KIX domain-containing protein n=1 Tax=Handroanthus impetiginosus TaxID=429701 RepID=A0A2G9IA04_9LAMI|nr:hypothetical protein CDL12_00648 [Handroanthus impetiginosus]
MEDGDWRSQLDPASRQRTLNQIMETLKRHLPFSGQEGLLEIVKIAVRFEEKIYTAATSQSDYLRKISLKLLTMETKSQNPKANSLQSNAASDTENPRDPDIIMNAQLRNQNQPMSSNNTLCQARAQELARQRKRRRRNTITESNSAKVSIDLNSSSQALIPVLPG